jgi:hypothetical protein
MKHFSLLRAGALTALAVCLLPSVTVADEIDRKTVVTFSERTEVPGIVLEPGTYVIRLLNSSSNRHIAEIMNERLDHLYTLTFVVPATKLEASSKPVITFYEQGSRPQALRKWFWPGEVDGQEFIYPKDQAARISAASNEKVPEGNLPTVAESNQSLTPDSAKGLSSLQSSSVKSDEQPKPAATAFTARAAEPPAPAEPAAVVAQNTVIAQNTPPPSPVRVEDTPQSNAAAPPSSADSSNGTLPETASPLPLIGAIGLISLALAGLMASVKRYRSS